jgi:hypothetical protein
LVDWLNAHDVKVLNINAEQSPENVNAEIVTKLGL